MIFTGCDVGTSTTKAVIMSNGKVVSYDIIATEARPEQKAKEVLDKALSKANFSSAKIEYCVSTGWGRKRVPYADMNLSEISCHGKGAQWLIPSIRTVIDVGCQGSRAIKVDERGKVVEYITNTKCSAGSGRFLEVMAEALELELEKLGPLALRSKNPLTITSQCSVFAESEVITYVNEGKDLADIVAGINSSIASRLTSLVGRIGIKEDVTITGGVAKNIGVTKNLEKTLGVGIKTLPIDPQIVGAIGAALFAREKLAKKG